MNFRLRASALVLFVVATFVCAPALAQRSNDALARNFFESGRAYFEQARYDEAAHAFAEAYRLSHRPELLVNQARAVEAADRRDEAIAILEQAERELPESQEGLRAEVEGRLNRLRAERDREQQDAEARAAEAQAAAEAARTQAAAPGEAAPGSDATGHRGNGRFYTGLSTGGLAVASLAVALGTGLRANAIEGDLAAACPGDVCPPDRMDDVDHGRRLARTSTAFTFLGVGAAAVAVPFLILGLRDRKHERAETRASITGGPGDVGLGLDLRF